MKCEDKDKMRDDIMFLRGVIEGLSYFPSDNNMANALETVQILFENLSDKMINTTY